MYYFTNKPKGLPSSLFYSELVLLLVNVLNSKVPLRIYDEVVNLENKSLSSNPCILDNSHNKLDNKWGYETCNPNNHWEHIDHNQQYDKC